MLLLVIAGSTKRLAGCPPLAAGLSHLNLINCAELLVSPCASSLGPGPALDSTLLHGICLGRRVTRSDACGALTSSGDSMFTPAFGHVQVLTQLGALQAVFRPQRWQHRTGQSHKSQ